MKPIFIWLQHIIIITIIKHSAIILGKRQAVGCARSNPTCVWKVTRPRGCSGGCCAGATVQTSAKRVSLLARDQGDKQNVRLKPVPRLIVSVAAGACVDCFGVITAGVKQFFRINAFCCRNTDRPRTKGTKETGEHMPCDRDAGEFTDERFQKAKFDIMAFIMSRCSLHADHPA